MHEERAVRVRVCGEQRDAAGEVTRQELEAAGRYVLRGGKHYVRYADETLAEGARVHTTLKLSAGEAWLSRRGGVCHEQRFVLGKRTRGTYRTPYGAVALAVQTQEVSIMAEEGRMAFRLGYDLYAGEVFQSHNTLRVEVIGVELESGAHACIE